MRTGFIGLGLIGSRRLKAARAIGHEIAYAVDIDSSRRSALELDEVVYAANTAQLTDASTRDVDVVFIAVPHDMILETCRWAAGRGSHILCEKPMGLSFAQAKDIAAIIGAADLKFGAGFNKRFLPHIAKLKALVRESAFGKIFRARIVMHHGGRPGMEKEWKVQRARAGGGALIDPGIHLIDLSRYLFGDVTVTNAELNRNFWDIDVEDTCLLDLRAGDMRIDIEVSLTSWKNIFELEVFGCDGYAKVTGRGGNYGAMKIEYVNRWFWAGEDRRMEQNFGSADPSFDLETTAFLRWVAGEPRDPALSTIREGLGAMHIVDQVYG